MTYEKVHARPTPHAEVGIDTLCGKPTLEVSTVTSEEFFTLVEHEVLKQGFELCETCGTQLHADLVDLEGKSDLQS